MGKVFVCASCGTAVSKPVDLLEDPSQMRRGDGEAAVPPGRFSTADPKEWSTFGGWYLLNLEDAEGLKEHPDYRRFQGCCGPSGLDGKNMLCANGHEIGTACSDCWMPHSLMLDPASVAIKPKEKT